MKKKRPMGLRRRRLWWTVAVLVLGTVGGSILGFAIYRSQRPATYLPGEDNPEITRKLARGLPEDAPSPLFEDVTDQSGLASFRSFAGERTSQLPEDMGSGLAWGDFDNDGDDDLFLVSAGGALDLPAEERAESELYENLGDGSFRRVAEFPATRIIGMAAAWGDYDGDGWQDLVVTGYRSLILYRNHEGRLERNAGFPEPDGYWSGASWGDYDNDLDLDLYVCGYVEYVEDDAGRATTSQQYGRAVPYTLNPASYPPARNLLFRNDGEGSFTEVAGELEVASDKGRSLGALWHDVNDDGLLDLYVANDISDNVLYINRGKTFEEISHSAWVADYRGAMGLAAGDWNRDGDDDLFVTHWIAQENALYDSLLRMPAGAPQGEPGVTELHFVDVADQRGLGQISLRLVGWGAEFADLDGDGWLDLAVANGSTFETDEESRGLRPQKSFLFWNRRGEHFHDLAPLNEALSAPHVRRGLAVADYDDDGDLDLAFMNLGEGVQLFRNDMQTGNWVKVRLRSKIAPGGKPHGLGDGSTMVAHVGEVLLRRTVGGPSYLSQSSRVVHIGLGEATRVDRLEVRWLAGERQVFEGLDAGSIWELTEGETAPQHVRSSPRVATPSDSPPQNDRERVLAFWAKHRAAMDAMKIDDDLPRAVELFREALDLNPSHEDARYYLADCLARTGDPRGAMEQLEELTRLSPQSHRAFKQLGILGARFATDRTELAAAQTALERAVEINQEETGALAALGETALIGRDYAAAERRLAWVCQTNPRAAGAFFFRGYAAWKRGDVDGARSFLNQAREAAGDEFVPEGTTSEGDVRQKMHTDDSPLIDYFVGWNGSTEPAVAYAPVETYLTERSNALRP